MIPERKNIMLIMRQRQSERMITVPAAVDNQHEENQEEKDLREEAEDAIVDLPFESASSPASSQRSASPSTSSSARSTPSPSQTRRPMPLPPGVSSAHQRQQHQHQERGDGHQEASETSGSPFSRWLYRRPSREDLIRMKEFLLSNRLKPS